MQPYAIRKHRELSMPVKFVIATVMTTVGLYVFKTYIRPVWVGYNKKKYDDFADDYFEKHKKI